MIIHTARIRSSAGAPFRRSVAVVIVLVLGGCASLGETPDEKRAAVLEMRDETLAMLYQRKPGARRQIAEAAGYGVFDAASQNVILLQTGGGYGVLTSASGETTFMRVGGAGVGFGIGLKDYREVIVFENQSAYKRFRDVGWDASGQAEATAQAGRQGGSASGKQSVDLDVRTYQITESGAALQATVGASKYWKWRELNR